MQNFRLLFKKLCLLGKVQYTLCHGFEFNNRSNINFIGFITSDWTVGSNIVNFQILFQILFKLKHNFEYYFVANQKS